MKDQKGQPGKGLGVRVLQAEGKGCAKTLRPGQAGFSLRNRNRTSVTGTRGAINDESAGR